MSDQKLNSFLQSKRNSISYGQSIKPKNNETHLITNNFYDTHLKTNFESNLKTINETSINETHLKEMQNKSLNIENKIINERLEFVMEDYKKAKNGMNKINNT